MKLAVDAPLTVGVSLLRAPLPGDVFVPVVDGVPRTDVYYVVGYRKFIILQPNEIFGSVAAVESDGTVEELTDPHRFAYIGRVSEVHVKVEGQPSE